MEKIISRILKITFFCLALNHLSFAEEAADSAQPAAAAAAPAPESVKAEAATDSAAAKADKAEGVDNGYQIGPEDIVTISVWKEDGLKGDMLVRPDGGISFPLVGDLQAAGKTAKQLQDEITKKLEKFIPDPVVSVVLSKVVGNKVYVIGKVNRPGEFPEGRYIDVMQALSLAGGLTPFAAENDIKILRKENGKVIALPFRYSDVQKGQSLEQNIQLKGGDTVVVP